MITKNTSFKCNQLYIHSYSLSRNTTKLFFTDKRSLTYIMEKCFGEYIKYQYIKYSWFTSSSKGKLFEGIYLVVVLSLCARIWCCKEFSYKEGKKTLLPTKVLIVEICPQNYMILCHQILHLKHSYSLWLCSWRENHRLNFNLRN